MIYLKRATYDAILKIECSFRVLLLTGPRQVGKTTLLKAIAQNHSIYSSWSFVIFLLLDYHLQSVSYERILIFLSALNMTMDASL